MKRPKDPPKKPPVPVSAVSAMSKTARSVISQIMESPTKHFTTCVQWYDDNGQVWAGPIAQEAMDPENRERCLVPKPNVLQERIERAIAYASKLGIPARIIVLKGRRSGSSLGCAAIVNLRLRRKKAKALVMADEYDRSDDLFDMVSQFATTDVAPWGFGAKATDTKIEYGNGSMIKKETAKDKNAGRGAGYRTVWFSEAAHYPSDGKRDARTLMLATLNTIPQKVGTLVIVESTANGPAGFYPETWHGAEWPADETYWKKWDQPSPRKENNIWLRVFAAWFEIERNAIDCTEAERERIFSTLTHAEKYGVEHYAWTAEQLKWRRYVVSNNFGGDEKKFDQEYPHSPESAFLATGTPAFDRDALRIMRGEAERARDEWQYGVLQTSGVSRSDLLMGKNRSHLRVQFHRTSIDEAWFAMIEPPKDGCRYIMPVDPASGAEVTDGTGDLDRTSIPILRAGYMRLDADGNPVQVPPRLVARIMWQMMDQHPEQDDTTLMAIAASHLYGYPVIPVETNKGEWVIGCFKRAGLNLYRTRTTPRDRTERVLEKYGWYTSEESRRVLVETMRAFVRGADFTDPATGNAILRPGVLIEDTHSIAELESFIRDKRGKFAASAGCHDDDVIALALGLHLIDSATLYRVKPRKAAR